MRFKLTLLLVVALALAPLSAHAQLMIIGNDEKVTWDDAGKPLFLPPGKDTVSIVDISNREAPRILASLPLMNSVFGPPTNLQITPDGKRALAVKFPGHKVAMLEINGQKVTYTKYDMPAGLWPYNIDITPNGKIALTADNGNAGASDGHVDTVSVIDLESTPPRVIDRVVVGDAPEGFAISPTGEIAVAILLNGSAGVPRNAWFANKAGKVVVLKIDGKKVTKIGEVEVGGLPEGVVFSPDGKYLYVGNYTDRDVSILKVDGTTVSDTGKRFKLPGQPASMRGAAR